MRASSKWNENDPWRKGAPYFFGVPGKKFKWKGTILRFKETRGQSLGLQEEMEIEGNSKKEKAIWEEP